VHGLFDTVLNVEEADDGKTDSDWAFYAVSVGGDRVLALRQEQAGKNILCCENSSNIVCAYSMHFSFCA